MKTPKELLSAFDYALYEKADHNFKTKLLYDALKKQSDYEVWVPLQYWKHIRANQKPAQVYYSFNHILISNKGRVYNSASNEFISYSLSSSGYKRFFINRLGVILHRAVACCFVPVTDDLIGNPLTRLQANHLNGIKPDCEYSNLEWTTPKQNMNHAFSTGLIVIGKGKDNARVKPLLGTVVGYKGFNGTKFIALGKEDIQSFNMKEAGAVARGNQAVCNGCTFIFAEETDLTSYPNITELPEELLSMFKEDKTRVIKGIDIKTGTEFEFKGKQALIDMGFDPSGVYKCVKGKLPQHKGFKFFL